MKKLVLEFLSRLEENNTREWFQANKELYTEAKLEVESFVNLIIPEIARFDESIRYVEAKDCMFRIFRDVRFSKDKTPYRTSMGASIAAGGRKSGRMAYYLHLEPQNQSMIAGGLYKPEPEQITRFRDSVSLDPVPFKSIISDPAFKQHFGGLQGEKLKTTPKGFAPDHPEIELIRLKEVVAIHTFTDAEVITGDFTGHIVEAFTALKPFLDFLNNI